MRRVILSCLIAIVSTAVSFATAIEIPITIQVQNATSSALYIQKAFLEQSQLTKTHRIDLTNGHAQFAYSVNDGDFIELIYNGYKIPMYLDKRSTPKISFDAQRISETLQFAGSGAAENNFIANYYEGLGGSDFTSKECSYLDLYFDKSADMSSTTLSVESYSNSLQQTYQYLKNVLSSNKPAINHKVYDFYAKKALYDKESNKLLWILSRWGELSSQEINAAKSVLNLDESVIHQGANNVNHPAFQNLLKVKAIWNYLPNDIHQYRAYTKIYEGIEQSYHGEAKCFMTSHLLIKVYEKSGETELGRSKISQLQNTCPNYTGQIMEMYGGDISGVEDIAASDIDMVDKSGSLISLEDYSGKVVYISFWASWCKPCIEGFKKSKDIRKRLQKMGVVLLNISIDKKEEAWRDAMIRHNPLGINTWAISLNDLSKDYDISAIPLYHIVNKQGKFAYLSDTNGRDIVEEFRLLVEQ